MTIEYKDSKRIVALSTSGSETIRNTALISNIDGGLAAISGWEQKQGIKLTSSESGKKLNRVTVNLKKTGAPSGNVQAVVIKGSNPQATVSASSNTIVANDLTSSYVATTFTFSSDYTTATDDYVMIIATGGASGNYVQIQQSSGVLKRVYGENGATSWLGGSGTENGVVMNVFGVGIKPTNVQVGSRYEETDTRKMYNLSELTFDDDFSTDKGWVSSGAQAKIDSSGYLLFDDDSDGSAHKIYYDIGNTLSDTKWLWRFKLTTNTFSMNTDPTPQIVHMRISNKTDHRDSATEDAIGMSFRTSDGNQEYIRTTYSDGITFGTTGNFSTDMATGTHYVQITRDSSTQFTVKLYSDSSYSSLVESNSKTIPSTITDLRYLKIDNMTSDGTSNGRMIFHIDDLEVYSGVNSISDTDYDTYWQEIGI